MNKFLTVLCLALLASASAKPAYNYQQPPKAQANAGFKQQSFRPSQSASSGGIFQVAPSPQLTSFNVQPQQQIKQNFVAQPTAPIGLPAPAPAVIGLPAPPQFAQQFVAPAPQYIAPVQQQQQFVAPVQQQQQFVAPVQQQQQFVAPVQQQQQQYVAPVQQQQQFVQQQQFTGPVQQQYQPANYQPQPQPQQTIISKDIYIHSAPEEVEEIGNDAGNTPAGPLRKNYRIVFIKAPGQNVKLNLDALKRAQASNEEKTVIYVLSKKPDLSELQSQLAVVQNDQKSHKPEVYFIKYKTQEEANRAQQEIQAQYDSLGGSTHISDEGIAPVTSVIGGGAINVGNLGGGSISGIGSGISGISSGSGIGSSFQGGNSFGQQQQQFVQQSYQTSQSSVGSSSSSVNFGGVPNQKYLPSKKK